MKYIIEDILGHYWASQKKTLIGMVAEFKVTRGGLSTRYGWYSGYMLIDGYTNPNGSTTCFFANIKLKPITDSEESGMRKLISDNCQEPQAQGFCAKTGDSSPSLKRESNMKVTTQHYINGTNVKDMSKTDCISRIADAEAEVKRLEKIDVNSDAITAEIKRVRKFIKDVVKHLDAK